MKESSLFYHVSSIKKQLLVFFVTVLSPVIFRLVLDHHSLLRGGDSALLCDLRELSLLGSGHREHR